MKKLTFLLMLAFSTVVFGQDSLVVKPKLSVVSADKMNVVYRGVSNPISIAVTDGELIAVSAPGLTKDGKGQYLLRPGQGNEVAVMVSIKRDDGSTIIEKHTFRIKGIPSPMGAIDERNCGNCIVRMTKKELKEAEISIMLPNLTFDVNLELASYNVKIPHKKTIVVVDNNKFPKDVLDQILDLKTGSIFYIQEIAIKYKFSTEGYLLPKVTPIAVMIIDEPIPYFQSKEFIKDSLNNIKKEKKLAPKQKSKQ